MVTADERDLIAYVRNLGGVLPQNVRMRAPQALRVTVNSRRGTLQIWDLDERQVVRTVKHLGMTVADLGLTDHDFALVVHGEK